VEIAFTKLVVLSICLALDQAARFELMTSVWRVGRISVSRGMMGVVHIITRPFPSDICLTRVLTSSTECMK